MSVLSDEPPARAAEQHTYCNIPGRMDTGLIVKRKSDIILSKYLNLEFLHFE